MVCDFAEPPLECTQANSAVQVRCRQWRTAGPFGPRPHSRSNCADRARCAQVELTTEEPLGGASRYLAATGMLSGRLGEVQACVWPLRAMQ